ncbi:hypothetical protein [Telmatospirillum sp.]|uniref:hypothetical protein n=1 Tax=Telmatospirillum sp. TaxID=2079197 RepID=UPI0028452483|nr:hypothetical protein [Telmatospirillum sp.]MDR3436571.1 hypothetical protein [Telmatospirillum sp.]
MTCTVGPVGAVAQPSSKSKADKPAATFLNLLAIVIHRVAGASVLVTRNHRAFSVAPMSRKWRVGFKLFQMAVRRPVL